MKRKDKRPKRESNANQTPRARPAKDEKRGEARSPAPGAARADHKGRAVHHLAFGYRQIRAGGLRDAHLEFSNRLGL